MIRIWNYNLGFEGATMGIKVIHKIMKVDNSNKTRYLIYIWRVNKKRKWK
jgi:hypothetical protein